MFCSKCGKVIDNNGGLCKNCGASTTATNENEQSDLSRNSHTNQSNQGSDNYSSPNFNYSQGYIPQPYFNINSIPPNYKPLSAWAYFGYNILFITPIIGQICLIIFACGGASNVNLKNYSRSFFCILLIIIILAVMLVAMGGFAFL